VLTDPIFGAGIFIFEPAERKSGPYLRGSKGTERWRSDRIRVPVASRTAGGTVGPAEEASEGLAAAEKLGERTLKFSTPFWDLDVGGGTWAEQRNRAGRTEN